MAVDDPSLTLVSPTPVVSQSCYTGILSHEKLSSISGYNLAISMPKPVQKVVIVSTVLLKIHHKQMFMFELCLIFRGKLFNLPAAHTLYSHL